MDNASDRTASAPWVLVLNAGSSSLKYAVVDPGSGDVAVRGSQDRLVPADLGQALEAVVEELRAQGVGAGDVRAVGHRVVHGGPDLTGPTRVDAQTLARIEQAARWAPLHNPPAVTGIRRARRAFGKVPHVAVFDTGFFAGLPRPAATYPIDRDVARAHRLRRFGAHGINHAWVTARAHLLLDRDPDDPASALDVVSLHLGSGASAAAVRGRRPLDTSMGLTPLEGLVMGSRPGDLDPGLVLDLLRHTDLGIDGVEDLLEHRSGLRGMTAASDMRDVLMAADAGDEDALLGYAVYCHRVRKYVGAYLAVLGGADVVVFTGGVGEHQPRVRHDVLAGLEPLGPTVDPERNAAAGGQAGFISPEGSPVSVLVVPADEETAIAREVASLLDRP